MGAIPLPQKIEYPYSNGQPIGESDLHIQEMVYLLEAFRERFRALADAYVAANMFFYFEQGNRAACLFDPLGEYLRPRLQGFRLFDGRYRRIEPAADGSLTSRTTGVVLRPEGSRIRAIDHTTGEVFLRNDELHDRVKELRAGEERTRARLEAAEEELARLRAELARKS